ncbi:MAG: hypothetical protein ABI553_08285 [Chloroflexota bacterium]
MPFDFLKRKRGGETAATVPASPAAAAPEGLAFDGLTEDWRLMGRMLVNGRISDALNKREAIGIVDVNWAPIDGSAPFGPAPGLRSVDPYDLILVLAGDDSLPDNSDERTAHRVHKVSYEVALEVPPYRVTGTVYLYPGYEPDSLLSRSTEMFVPIVDAQATIEERPVGDSAKGTILVNRQYLRGVEQIDARTGERHAKLPGGSMGGVNWTDRAR